MYQSFSEQKGVVVELNVQIDHVHLLVSGSTQDIDIRFVGMVKGRTAIRVFNKFRHLKQNLIGVIISGQEVTRSIPWLGYRKDMQICKVPRAERASRRVTTEI